MAKSIELRSIERKRVSFTIRGTSPYISHAWSGKTLEMMREKHAGKKTKTREKRDPQKEADEATYRTADGRFGIPGMGFKTSLITAAHKDIGIEKTLVRKSIFLVTDDPEKVLPLTSQKKPILREDSVRVGSGSADLRYRPMFVEWSVAITLDCDMDLLKTDDVANLVNRAGFGVGIGEWRPEKNGEFGRFEIDAMKPFEVEDM